MPKTRRKKRPRPDAEEMRLGASAQPSVAVELEEWQIPPGGLVRINHRGAEPVSVRFHEVDSPELIQIEDLETPLPLDRVRGRFVKLAPRLPRSARASFDGPALVQRLREAGARAVLFAPVWVPDEQRPERSRIATAPSPREALREWFRLQRGMAKKDREAAQELVLGYMDQEGM